MLCVDILESMSTKSRNSGSSKESSSTISTSESSQPIETCIRLKEYTGLEVKTLWNHFNKESLITSYELAALLERILIKDATDLLTDLKKGLSWRKYASRVLSAMDTSKGETLDMAEFSDKFNATNQRRLFYFLKYLFPDLLSHLRDVCEQMGLTVDEMKELDKILKGRRRDDEEIVLATVVEDVVPVDTSDKDEIDRLNGILRELQQEQADTSELHKQLTETRKLLTSEQLKIREYKTELDNANSVISELRSALQLSQDELNELKHQQKDSDKLVSEVEQLRDSARKNVDFWTQKFEGVISENDELRSVLLISKHDIEKLNFEVLRVSRELKDKLDEKNGGLTKISGASLTGIDLDPLRTELVRRYGSIDAFIASLDKKVEKRGITLNELELLGVSMGYSREYCKKLFYTLDTNDKGIVSTSQFSRPLPIINKELCLLTKRK